MSAKAANTEAKKPEAVSMAIETDLSQLLSSKVLTNEECKCGSYFRGLVKFD